MNFLAQLLSDPVIQVVGGLTAIGTFLALVAKTVKSWRAFKKRWRTRVGNFLDDWEGRAARPGHDREPGVMERLKVLEETQASQGNTLKAQDDVLETIRHEVEFNNGSSVKDAVTRIEKRFDEHLNPVAPQTTVNINPRSAP